MLTIPPSDLIALRPSVDLDAASVMVQGAVARAARIAPCILADDFAHERAVRSIILDALVRRVDAGGGGIVTQQTAGPFGQSFDTRAAINLFTGQERTELAALCGAVMQARTVYTEPGRAPSSPLDGAQINGGGR